MSGGEFLVQQNLVRGGCMTNSKDRIKKTHRKKYSEPYGKSFFIPFVSLSYLLLRQTQILKFFVEKNLSEVIFI